MKRVVKNPRWLARTWQEEKFAELADKVSKLAGELEAATNKLNATETLGESERAAAQEALDELTRSVAASFPYFPCACDQLLCFHTQTKLLSQSGTGRPLARGP